MIKQNKFSRVISMNSHEDSSDNSPLEPLLPKYSAFCFSAFKETLLRGNLSSVVITLALNSH